MKKKLLFFIALAALSNNALADRLIFSTGQYEKFDISSVPEYDKDRVEDENSRLASEALTRARTELKCGIEEIRDITNIDEVSYDSKNSGKKTVLFRINAICISAY